MRKKFATVKMIKAALLEYGNLGNDFSKWEAYTLQPNGEKKYLGFSLYRDSLHLLAGVGFCKFDESNWTYSVKV